MTDSNNKKRRVLITSALPYSNGKLHVGHIAGAYLPADIYVRYLRLSGADVRFVCGSDDHGVAIMLSADKEGKTPEEVAAFYSDKQKKDFADVDIEFDIYGSTSQSLYHAKTSQDLFLKLYEKGYFEKQKSRQFYDRSRSMFLPDRFVKGTCGYCSTPDQHGDQCENCGKVLDIDTLLDAVSVISEKPAEIEETTHWFLDLSRCEDIVSEWIEKSFIREHTKNFVKGLISTGLVKRSMTRDISWGIPLPLDDPDAEGKVLYVWFDAPIGYISNTKELCQKTDNDAEKYEDWWKSKDTEIYHFIGEDNTIFHCIIWIAMLSAEGTFELPRGVIVNQFLNIQFPDQEEEEKISKSRGTAIWIDDYIGSGGSVDTLRYYLTSVAPERARTVYRPYDHIQKNNTDLANVLGNFVNRIVSFTHKYVGPAIPECQSEQLNDIDKEFLSLIRTTHQKATEQLEAFSFRAALDTIMEFCRASNKYVDEKAPWKTRKTDMEATCLTLNVALQAIHLLAITLQPFIPRSAAKIAKMLNLEELSWAAALTPNEPGHALNEAEILFSKIQEEK